MPNWASPRKRSRNCAASRLAACNWASVCAVASPKRIAVRQAEHGESVRYFNAPATDAELQLVHSSDFIDATKRAGDGEEGDYRTYGYGPGDNPIFPRMHEAGAIVAGTSIAAARAVLEGSVAHAFNAAGGLPHAMPSRSSRISPPIRSTSSRPTRPTTSSCR